MNFEFEQPDLTNITVSVELRIRIVTKVLEQTKILPPFRSNGSVSSAGSQDEPVYRKAKLNLFNQPIVCACEGLFAKLPCRRIGENATLQPILIRVLTR